MAQRYKRFLPYRIVIVSNLLLVIVPILIMISLFIAQTDAQVRGEVAEMRRVNLERTQRSVDSMLQNFGSMVLYASMDSDLKPYQLSHNNYDTITALHHLKQHASALSEMEIFFYIYSDDCLYSTSGRVDFSTLERVYTFEGGWSADDFYDFLATPGAYSISPTGCRIRRVPKQDEYVAVLYPWKYGSVSYGSVIGLIRASWFDQQLYGEDSDRLCVLNALGEPLFGDDALLSDEFLESVEPGATAEATLQGERVRLVWAKSPLTGWHYMTAIPETHIFSLLYGRHLSMYIAVLALLLGFSTLGVCLAIRYYQPVHNLEEVLSVKGAPAQGDGLHDRVMTILENNEDLRLELEETRDYMIQELIAQLVWGRLSYDECQARLSKLDFRLDGPAYAAAVIGLGHEASMQTVAAALDALSREGLYASESFDGRGSYLVLIYSGRADEGRFADEFGKRLADCIRSVPEARVRIGVGQIRQRLTEVNGSFIEALAALRSDAPDELRYFDEMIETNFEMVDKPLGYQRIRLSEIIRQGGSADVEAALNELERYVAQLIRRTDAPNLRFMLDSILNDLMQIFSEAGLANIDWKINLAVHTNEPEQFIEHLRPLCCQAAQAFAQKRDNWQNQRSAEIMRYIDAHYVEHSLSQASVAAEFDMTPTALSRLFNECMGVRFIDYVSQKRMTHAAELLAETEWGVREIVNMVGYIDASSFTRKFTANYGMSPNAYRARFQQEKSEKGDDLT